MFHELYFIDSINPISYLASGSYRDAFRMILQYNGEDRMSDTDGNNDDELGLKLGYKSEEIILKFGSQEQDIDDELIEMIRVDAMVMDLLSDSDRILDLYGHCGTTVSVAPMNGHPLSTLIETKDTLSPEEKFYIALSMARSIADLHGHTYGTIVHGDIQYLQWLLDEHKNVILVDLNRAEPLLYNEESGEYCKYFIGSATGNVRSPEEYMNELLDEKIDVYSYGIAIYTLLTSKEPYWDEGIEDIENEIENGNKPIVDNEIRNHSVIEAKLASVMDLCLEFDAEKRNDIFHIISILEEFSESQGDLMSDDAIKNYFNQEFAYYDISDSNDGEDEQADEEEEEEEEEEGEEEEEEEEDEEEEEEEEEEVDKEEEEEEEEVDKEEVDKEEVDDIDEEDDEDEEIDKDDKVEGENEQDENEDHDNNFRGELRK